MRQQFDPTIYARELQERGVPLPQAYALAETQARLRYEVWELDVRMSAQIEGLRMELKYARYRTNVVLALVLVLYYVLPLR